MAETKTEGGIAHKVISVILRLFEFAAGVIVLGILARFVYLLNTDDSGDNPSVDGRIIYAMVVACLTIVYTLIVGVPLKALFLGFPMDFVLFIMWLVAYCLLQTRTVGGTCSVGWYYNYWGFYWGQVWRFRPPFRRFRIDGAGCSEWRTVLAFSFIAWLFHLVSGVLGVYVFQTYIKSDGKKHSKRHHGEKFDRNHTQKDSHEQHTPDGRSEATVTPTTAPATLAPATETPVTMATPATAGGVANPDASFERERGRTEVV